MNDIKKPKRSNVGIELVRLMGSEGYRIFSIDRARELSPQVGLKDPYLAEALHHLSRSGWIVPLRRGLYAISTSVPGMTPAHEFEIAMALVNPAAISHWSAFHLHGLTEQVPRKVFVLTTTKTSVPRVHRPAPGTKKGYSVAGNLYQFVRVKPERFFGFEKIWAGDVRVTITDRERTLLDGLSMPKYCGDLAEVLHAFETTTPKLDLDRIIDYATRLDVAVAKRLGWVLEKQGVDSARLDALLRLPMKGYGKLDPNGPRLGPYNRRWMLRENLSGNLSQ